MSGLIRFVISPTFGHRRGRAHPVTTKASSVYVTRAVSQEATAQCSIPNGNYTRFPRAASAATTTAACRQVAIDTGNRMPRITNYLLIFE